MWGGRLRLWAECDVSSGTGYWSGLRTFLLVMRACLFGQEMGMLDLFWQKAFL